MTVLIFGARGKTGRLVVELALDRGHKVSVLMRDPGKVSESVRVIVGDATDRQDVFK
jgi:uncharacterized protein YbjT (DUF2867 family)